MMKGIRLRRNKTEAYFTVEAALILPMVLGVILLVIYMWFFQYNRCLLEQDTGILAVRGDGLLRGDYEAGIEELRIQEQDIWGEKYIAWEMDGADMEMRHNSLLIKQTGGLIYPFRGGNQVNGSNVWETNVSYSHAMRSPIIFIRSWYKLAGGR